MTVVEITDAGITAAGIKEVGMTIV